MARLIDLSPLMLIGVLLVLIVWGVAELLETYR